MSFPKAIVITTLGKHPKALANTVQMAAIADDAYSEGAGPRKRRRLTHLSADEKMMRRKLKNRVAAQTARDRKKALMQELEEQVAQLQEEKKQLMKENAQLRLSHSTVQKENHCLKKLLTSVGPTAPEAPELPPTPQCKAQAPASAALPCKTEPVSPGSAVPAVSLPKEQIQALSCVMMRYAACAVTLSLIFCCLSWNKSREEGSSRKRKQTKPARRPLGSLELPAENSPQMPAWWGPQQRTWTPSMN